MGDLINFVFTDMSNDYIIALEFVGFITVLYCLVGIIKVIFGLMER